MGEEVPVGKKTNYGGISVAQSFVVSQSGIPLTAIVRLALVGSFPVATQYLTATIEGNSAGAPDNSPVATSTPIDVSTISTAANSISFSLQNQPTLDPALTYWLRVKGTFPVSDTNYINWYGVDGYAHKYQVGTSILNSVYETSILNTFSISTIGQYRFLLFKIGC